MSVVDVVMFLAITAIGMLALGVLAWLADNTRLGGRKHDA